MRAKSMGMHWAPYTGLRDARKHVIAAATEAEFFKRLGLPIIEPARRER
jgi:DNA polymerase/3'-5' exonuclease PolX